VPRLRDFFLSRRRETGALVQPVSPTLWVCQTLVQD